MASTTVQEAPDKSAARQHSVRIERYSVTGNPQATRAVVERLNGKIVTVGHNNSTCSEGELEREAATFARQFDAVLLPPEPEPELPAELSDEERELFRENERRAQLVAGLRELARFYVDHPEAPIPRFPDFAHCVNADNDEAGSAEVEAIAAALGVEVEHGAHVRARRQFGAIAFNAYYVPSEVARRHAANSSYYGAVEPDGGTSDG